MYPYTTCTSCGVAYDSSITLHTCQGIQNTIQHSYCVTCNQYYTGNTHICLGPTIQTTVTHTASNYNPLYYTLESILNLRQIYGEKGKCFKCKNDRNLVIGYKIIMIERKLCEECLAEVADKLFGVEANVNLEKNLFGKS
jgi:hypothetical protein